MNMRNNWPVKLFWLPYGPPSVFISLGCVSSSFLLNKRLRQRKGGCFVASDVNSQSPPDSDTPDSQCPPISSTADGCSKVHSLRRKARTCVAFLEKELRLKRARALPSRIECGHLRSAIRSCFDHLDEIGSLSVKTTQKLEKSFCPWCRSAKVLPALEKWKEERFHDTYVDEDHLSYFATCFGRNVEQGWDRMKFPYVPNGNACLGVSRCEGGTWIPGEFSPDCEVMSVVSAGKPRVVTLYSERNSSLLHSLHHSLYSTIRRKGWLLVGDPTNELVASLNGGDFISVDYSSATDNVKIAYCRAAIEVLISKSESLDEEQAKALRVVSTLVIDGKPATRGQPMGSLISFPLLCLINKTVVDMALTDLMREGQISSKEWTSHRCLINGDDLLLRDSSAPGKLLPRIVAHGERVGLVLNVDKTMVDACKGEINSTLFINSIKQKKTNCAALFMAEECSDVIGYSHRSTATVEGFLFCVRRSRSLLEKQKVKLGSPITARRFNALLSDPLIRRSLSTQFSRRTEDTNPFPVVTKPAGYALTREEQIDAIQRKVVRLRSWGYVPCPHNPGPWIQKDSVSVRRALKRPKPRSEDVLAVLAAAWERKQKDLLTREDSLSEHVPFEHVCDRCAVLSLARRTVCEIRELKRVTWLPARVCQVPGTDPSGWAL